MIRKLGHTIAAADKLTRKWILDPLWHLVWPRECAMCNHLLMMHEEHLCDNCRNSGLPKTEEAWHRDNRLECIFTNVEKFQRGAAYCFYPKEHPIRNAIHRMKYDSKPEIGRLLGQMVAEEWKDSGFFDSIDCIIPLPLHKERLRERGYNQAEWIAMGIQDMTGLPIDNEHLIRVVNNDKQSRLSLDDRQKLGNIFAVRHPEQLRKKHVLLIDDVVTSGTTMLRAMETLHPIPNCHYSIFCLALAHN